VDNVKRVDSSSTQEAYYVEVGILDALRGDRLGQYSIRISDGDPVLPLDAGPADVEIVDYH